VTKHRKLRSKLNKV